jgi:hypothetical protein
MSKDKNTKIVREQGHDKFYTNENIVDICINSMNKIHDINKFDLIIEPSAGNGSFLLKLPLDKRVGLDILPEHPEIIKNNFFDYIPNESCKNILVIGNPPFGKVSSLAIKFFNHASKFANFIAFIIPRTFRKISVQNKLNLNFHLKHDEDVPLNPCSFTPRMMVKCCFQVWGKSDIKRNIIKLPIVHPHWTFLSYGPKDENNQPTPPQNADFALRAYGGKCGDIITEKLQDLRPKSWHWIKCNIDKDKLINRFKQLDYTNSLNTARQNSIGRAELVSLYSDFLFTNFEL